MASIFTPNINIEEPARGDDVGTWDTPVNNNMTLLDLVAGGIATISGAAGSVVLAPAQFRSKGITFNSTLLASISVTFPTTFTKSYEIQHLCTGSSTFTITLATTAAGGQVIACPPGETIDCFNDGANIKFKNLGRVASYWDYAGSSVPSWVSGCTVPPYLNCDGTAFSSATYPQLTNILGTTTLPDSRGRARYALDAGTNRVTNGISGINGNTIFATGGSQSLQQHTHTVTDPGHSHTFTYHVQGTDLASPTTGNPHFGTNNTAVTAGNGDTTTNSNTGITNQNTGAGASQNMPPVYVGGLTLIRAA